MGSREWPSRDRRATCRHRAATSSQGWGNATPCSSGSRARSFTKGVVTVRASHVSSPSPARGDAFAASSARTRCPPRARFGDGSGTRSERRPAPREFFDSRARRDGPGAPVRVAGPRWRVAFSTALCRARASPGRVRTRRRSCRRRSQGASRASCDAGLPPRRMRSTRRRARRVTWFARDRGEGSRESVGPAHRTAIGTGASPSARLGRREPS